MADTPKIRFKGFADAWEQRKLSEVATMHARIGWQNLRTSEFLDSGEYMLITGTDFDDGRVNYDTCHYVEKERYEQDKHIQIKNGSILITKDGTLGKVAYVQGLSMPATLNAGVFNVVIKDEKKVDGKYLFQYLKAPFLMDYVNQKATGGTIKHLNQNILVDFPVMLPFIDEQVMLGRYFETLDHLITLHQHKCDETKELKRYMLQKMFPRNGKKNPEIRFSGFTDDWEQRKYSEIIDLLSGQDFNPNEYNEDGIGIPYLTGASCIENGHTIAIRWTECPRCIAKQGDTVFVCKGSGCGTIATVNQEKAHIARQFMALKVKMNRLDNKFNYYLLTSVMKNIKTDARGLIAGIARDAVLTQEVKIPSLEEQEEIADYFRNLDHLIILHQRKCDELKEVKKFMLQNMFPQKG